MTRLAELEELVLCELLPPKPIEVAAKMANQVIRNPRTPYVRTALQRFMAAESDGLDPEIFAPLFALGEVDVSGVEADALAFALLVHLGVENESGFARRRPNFLRLSHSRRTVLRASRDGWVDVTESVLDAGRATKILWPFGSLFDDILSRDFYPDRVKNAVDRRRALESLDTAMALVGEFSPSILDIVLKTVRTLVVLPTTGSIRHSFSCRTSYLGGIFIDLERDPTAVAEDLIHETVHQCLWSRWCVQEIRVAAEPSIYSPLTGRWRPADVMSHAYVIYCLAALFHMTLRNPTPASQLRRSDLNRAIPEIALQLRQCVASSEAHRLFGTVEALLGRRQFSLGG